MSNKLNVSASPHVRSKVTTSALMLDVVIAMIPTALLGIYNCYRMSPAAGINAVLVILLCCGSCVLTEYLFEKGTKKPVTIGDYSAIVTGLILALNMPTAMGVGDLWICVIGGVFAILVVKMLYGGLGQNFMNPALAARCFLLISFTGRMTSFVYDGVSGATPLATIRANIEAGNAALDGVNSMDMLIGNIAGTIGETSVIAIVIGAIILILKGIIDLRIPGTYIVTFALFIGIFGGFVDGIGFFNVQYMTAELCGGGLMLGAWFMATDYVTSPITKKGQIVYGILLGCLTGLFRLFGGSAEGVSYAIIFSNLLVPLIERVTLPKPFGKGGEK